MNPDGTLLAQETCIITGSDDIDAQLPTTGTYTVWVDSNTAATGSLTLDLSEDLTETITIGGPPVTVAISRPGRNALVTFNGGAGQVVNLSMTDVTFPSCLGVFILTPDGSLLGLNTCVFSGDASRNSRP